MAEGVRETFREDMMRREFTFPSSDRKTTIRGFLWVPQEPPKAVVQLVHGMEEHIGRYDALARFLNEEGYGVIGHDHLGHGESVAREEDHGFFAEEKGHHCVLKDMRVVTRIAQKQFPGRKIFMLGHSMGSFFARRYITLYPQALDGLILSGTGSKPYNLVHVGKRLARLMSGIKGDHYRSRLVETLALGGRPLEKWLCSYEEAVEAYKKDPLCGRPFTVGAYRDFFRLMEELAMDKDQNRVPRDLPILLIAGLKDPVGDNSKGVLRVYNRYRAQDMKDVDV
ncbi:MAG: lysophospholipase, partial [Lachnospiraceae bacterium]|nr:lysophospholipase [Lachnospiraceae bacterium]